MSQFNSREYYLERANTSRMLAEGARDPQVAAIHFEFAARYDLLVATVPATALDASSAAAPSP